MRFLILSQCKDLRCVEPAQSKPKLPLIWEGKGPI